GASEAFRALVGDRTWPLEVPGGVASGPSSAIRDRRVINVPDVLADGPGRWAEAGEEFQGREPIRAMLSIPLRRAEAVLGALSLWRDRSEPFTDEQVRVVHTFADQAALAVENVGLVQQIEEE